MRSSIFLSLAGLATLALARVPLSQRSENLGIYARDAEPDYGFDLSERDEDDSFYNSIYARDLDYDLSERDADPYDDEEPLDLFVRDRKTGVFRRMDHGIFTGGGGGSSHQASAGKGDPKHAHDGPGIKKTTEVSVTGKGPARDPTPFYLPARKDAGPVKYKIVNGKTVRAKRNLYDDYYAY